MTPSSCPRAGLPSWDPSPRRLPTAARRNGLATAITANSSSAQASSSKVSRRACLRSGLPGALPLGGSQGLASRLWRRDRGGGGRAGAAEPERRRLCHVRLPTASGGILPARGAMGPLFAPVLKNEQRAAQREEICARHGSPGPECSSWEGSERFCARLGRRLAAAEAKMHRPPCRAVPTTSTSGRRGPGVRKQARGRREIRRRRRCALDSQALEGPPAQPRASAARSAAHLRTSPRLSLMGPGSGGFGPLRASA